MLRNVIIYALVAMLVGLVLVAFRWWASTASFDYRAPMAAFGIITMLVIGVIGWRRMNKVARWYLIGAFVVGTLAILVSAWQA